MVQSAPHSVRDDLVDAYRRQRLLLRGQAEHGRDGDGDDGDARGCDDLRGLGGQRVLQDDLRHEKPRGGKSGNVRLRRSNPCVFLVWYRQRCIPLHEPTLRGKDDRSLFRRNRPMRKV